jgi:hypothetical protein
MKTIKKYNSRSLNKATHAGDYFAYTFCSGYLQILDNLLYIYKAEQMLIQ